MSKVRFFVLTSVLALCGCTMIPKYKRPEAPVAAQYPGASQTNAGFAASELGWSNFFSDERLKQLIDLALVNNRDLRVAVLNVEQSRAQYRITRSASFPTVDASGSFTRSYYGVASGQSVASTSGAAAVASPSGIYSSQWSANIGTTAYELDLFGHVRSLNSQALEKYLATAEARRDAQITLVSEVATEYFTLRQLEEQLQVARQTLAAVEESYRLNKASFDAGEHTELDLRTAEGQVQSARINILTYERQHAEAVNYLVLLVGQPLPENLPAPRAFDDTNLVSVVPAGLPSELLQRRPDILEAEHTLKAANANVGAARAAFFPTISLTASMGTTSSQLNQLFGTGTGLWSFSPQISVPIFTGGQNRADLDSAKAGARIEVANYEKAIQTAFREVADALADRGSYREQLPPQRALANAQQRRFDLATLRYRQGEDTYLNVLSAQQDLYSAQQGLVQLQFNILSADIALYKSLGGGWK